MKTRHARAIRAGVVAQLKIERSRRAAVEANEVDLWAHLFQVLSNMPPRRTFSRGGGLAYRAYLISRTRAEERRYRAYEEKRALFE